MVIVKGLSSEVCFSQVLNLARNEIVLLVLFVCGNRRKFASVIYTKDWHIHTVYYTNNFLSRYINLSFASCQVPSWYLSVVSCELSVDFYQLRVDNSRTSNCRLIF